MKRQQDRTRMFESLLCGNIFSCRDLLVDKQQEYKMFPERKNVPFLQLISQEYLQESLGQATFPAHKVPRRIESLVRLAIIGGWHWK